MIDLFVNPKHYPWLVTTTLDVMFETDLDFDIPTLSKLDPRSGWLELQGPGAAAAQTEIRRRLDELGVKLSEVRVA